jgi:glutamyl-tRNA synthetase
MLLGTLDEPINYNQNTKIMNTPSFKTRFCPSPTGLLHLGNLRTALFNALAAEGQQGSFLLRIEDTDKTRSDVLYVTALEQDLKWLGLDWDEGPGCENGAGPYFQSQRQSIYDNYYLQLERAGRAYHCFCSEEQLALARKIQRSSGRPPRYSGTCRNLTPAQIEEKLAQGLKPTLRFKVPQDEVTEFTDLVRGVQCFENNDIGDFVIRRADGTAPFMYCNAIDDALMGVTHALRGEDHLTNTPRQVMILNALKLATPHYGHISLIIGADGAPLSKRHGSRSLQQLREEGYFPLAIINYLARLGHYYAETHYMSFMQLAEKFSIQSLGAASARFDAQQLLFWQHEAVLHADLGDLWEWMGQEVHDLVPARARELFVKTIRNNVTFPGDALHWANVFYGEMQLNEEKRQLLITAAPGFFDVVLKILDKEGPDFNAVIEGLKAELNVKGKTLFQPLRIALAGELNGPELASMFELLEIQQLKQRINEAKTIAENVVNV